MQLTNTKNEIVEVKNVTGLMDCIVKHEIKTSTAQAKYVGPKIPPSEWQLALAFMKVVYDQTKSESQLRLYVNVEQKTWKAWAYPQEARTGMSARELDTEEAKKQRAEFKDSEGWLYFGTIHSHCSMGAFQSGTDEENEHRQDGLHLTVGHLDKDRYDLHARFYRNGLKFNPDMSQFWDVGEPWSLAPDEFVNKDKIARWQMCLPEDDVKVPDIWFENVIEDKRPGPPAGFHGGNEWPWSSSPYCSPYAGYSPNVTSQRVDEDEHRKGKKKGKWKPMFQRLEDADKDLSAYCDINQIDHKALIIAALELQEEEFQIHLKIFRACLKHEVPLEELCKDLSRGYQLKPAEPQKQLGLPTNSSDK